MAELILKNNIQWDQALINQVKKYKQDKTVPQLADKNFTAVAEAVTLGQDGKITLTKTLITKSSPLKTLMRNSISSWLTQPWLSVGRTISTGASRPSTC